MSLRSADEYLAGLRDGRRVRYRGEIVEDVTSHPELGVAARHARSISRWRMTIVSVTSPLRRTGAGGEHSAYYRIPRTAEDLVARSSLIETGTREGGTLVLLVKEIGTDALFALMRVLARAGREELSKRVDRFFARCRDEDLAVAVAQTDVKGDRSRRPRSKRTRICTCGWWRSGATASWSEEPRLISRARPTWTRIIVLPSRSMGVQPRAGDGPGPCRWSARDRAVRLRLGVRGHSSVARQYLRGAWDARRRVPLLNLAGELTTRAYAGYQEVLAVHAEGSLEAEKLAMRAYDAAPAIAYAMRLAGLSEEEAVG